MRRFVTGQLVICFGGCLAIALSLFGATGDWKWGAFAFSAGVFICQVILLAGHVFAKEY